MEQADVVVVGGRLAGCAVAAPLARAGRKVVVLDKMAFPSDQLSTHLLMPAGTSEFSKMGALPRILALNPSIVRYTHVEAESATASERLRPTEDGIDFGVCIPRDLQDVCLVEAAREQGADVRERCTFKALHWRAGRVSGVRYSDADGAEHDIEATLVVGADGRRSSVAAAVGAWTPYRLSRNGRGLVFRYIDDSARTRCRPRAYYQWREGDSFAFAFPSAPQGQAPDPLHGPPRRGSEARKDPEGYWQRKLERAPRDGRAHRRRRPGHLHQGALDRRDPGVLPRLLRPGLGAGRRRRALQGSGHRPGHARRDVDGPHAGRARPPRARRPGRRRPRTRAWEADRDRHCLPAYHFANLDTRVERQSPALCELVRDAGRNQEADITDLFGRARTLQQIAPLPRLTRAAVAALARGERPRGETLTRCGPSSRPSSRSGASASPVPSGRPGRSGLRPSGRGVARTADGPNDRACTAEREQVAA